MNIINNQTDIDYLNEQLNKSNRGNASSINYVVRDDFDLVSAFDSNSIDIVFSQAAFEHFDDINQTIAQLSAVCKPGAVIIAEIDLKTHSRWIRDKDPNNIYRYNNSIYKVFCRRGFPNRMRPFQYKNAFESNGWTDIAIIPLETLSNHSSIALDLNRQFQDEINQMNFLSVMFCARKQ